MAKANMTTAYIIRDFRDEGSETNYTAGSVLDIEEGVFANYAAAGLVRTPTDKEAAPAEPEPTTEA